MQSNNQFLTWNREEFNTSLLSILIEDNLLGTLPELMPYKLGCFCLKYRNRIKLN